MWAKKITYRKMDVFLVITWPVEGSSSYRQVRQTPTAEMRGAGSKRNLASIVNCFIISNCYGATLKLSV